MFIVMFVFLVKLKDYAITRIERGGVGGVGIMHNVKVHGQHFCVFYRPSKEMYVTNAH